jgi:hypothetical protein
LNGAPISANFAWYNVSKAQPEVFWHAAH